MSKYFVNSKTGRTKNKTASLSTSGMGSTPSVFQYNTKKEATVTVGYHDDPVELLRVDPLEDSQGSGITVKNAIAIGVSNVGAQTAAIQLKIPNWDNLAMGTTHTLASGPAYTYINWLLRPGSSITLPGAGCVSGVADSTSAACSDVEYCYDGGAKDNENERPAQLHPLIQDPGTLRGGTAPENEDISAKYTGWSGDWNYHNQDVFNAAVPQGIGGNSGILNHGGHASSSATAPFHYTPGGVCIRFFDPGVIRFGLKHQTTSTTTELTASTNYSFKITLDGGATQEVKFTTDSADLTWGSGTTGNSVLAKINLAMKNLEPFISQANEELKAPQFKIENGDIVMYTTTAKYDGGAGANDTNVAFSGSGLTAGYTYLNNVGKWPTMATLASGLVKPKLKELSRTAEMMFDDGYGNLVLGGRKVGEIEYNSGFMSFNGAPPYTSMEAVGHFGTALGGTMYTDMLEQADRQNHLSSVLAISTNIMRKATIKVVAYEI